MTIVEVVTVFAIIATNLTTVIVLHCHQDNKTTAFFNALQAEMKDFHEKLIRIEERNKK